ncbi:MAG: hypothetical protein KA248_09815 [Kiritimatiellae bacterium]|nr:hypothetical protein [Kiritimatiellia bacterium]
MKKTHAGWMIAAVMTLVAWNPWTASAQAICDDPVGVNLIAGQHHDAGDVLVGNDDEFLFIVFLTQDGWGLKETHVSVGAGLSDIPQTKTGNPQVGRFEYKSAHSGETMYVYVIPLETLGFEEEDCGVVAAHAVVEKVVNGAVVQRETGWGQGENFPGRNWAMYFPFCVEECSEGEG